MCASRISSFPPRRPPRNGSTAKTEEKPGPHFINVTDTVSLDDTSKTEVRVQVMREYHRRRKQVKAVAAAVTTAPISSKAPLSAKSQTHKFRLDREKTLYPWVRMKPPIGKKKKSASQEPHVAEKSLLEAPLSAGSYRQDRVRREESSEPPIVDVETQASLAYAQTNADTPSIANLEAAMAQQCHPTLGSSHETTSMYKNPAPGVLDPFSAMSLRITPRTQQLLHYYFNVRLAASWLMMPMRKGLFSLAIHHAALFHTFMSHYVAAYNLRSSTGDPAESMQHRTEAIRIVNEMLQDPEEALSDGNIAAVANMAVYESSNGSTKSMTVHLNGLVEMVNMRGGIQNGGFAPHVKRLVGWTDLHCATALSTKPRLPPLGIPMTDGPDDTSLDFPMSTQYLQCVNIHDHIGLDDTLAQIRALSETMAVLRKQPILPEENIWYSDKIYSLQHRLFDILHSPVEKRGELDAACCIAALIFCATCLRDITFNFRAIANALTRLRNAIIDFLDQHWTPRVDYLLGVKLFWVLGLGGIASEGKDEREWFVEKFRKMAGVLGLKSWESAELVLGEVLWQADLSSFGRKLWAEAHYLIYE